MKCCICESEENTHVVASRFGAMSDCYCIECLKQGKENYHYMVSYFSCVGEKMENFNESYQKEAIRQLELHGKTIGEFELDLKRVNEEMNNYFDNMMDSEEWNDEEESILDDTLPCGCRSHCVCNE